LIELLVVIAIVVVLAGILFPVYNQARGKAQQAKCSSNLKQIGTAIQIYIQDYDETFPPLYIDMNGRIPSSTLVDSPEWKGLSWTERIYPYVKNEELFKCPGDPAAAHRAAVNARFLNSFAYNPLFGTQPHPTNSTRLAPGALTLAQLNQSSEVAMLWDTPVNPTVATGPLSKNNLSRDIPNRSRALEYLFVTDSTRKAEFADEGMFTVAREADVNWLKPRHNEHSNVLFADSHVKPIRDPAAGARNNTEANEKLMRFFDPRYASR
jgi:prepilin-type processing-associated H-X9-DG protein